MNDDNNEIIVLGEPTKSLHDKKEYRVIKLKNGLTALLISDLHSLGSPNEIPIDDGFISDSDDEEEDKSNDEESEDEMSADGETLDDASKSKYLAAASLTIGAGSFEDLNEIEGLMHFLEHMVFMGSTKFPKENYFDNFIKRHGGNDNAQTDLENTTFYFDVQEMYFEKGLDIFAQFFISPLMKAEAMQRERKAVHSEFQESLNDDDCRKQQLLSSMAKEGHPMSLFSFGNEQTLQANVTDNELHQKLHALRSKFYAAHLMTLCVQAREPLDKLQSIVADIFSKIPCNDTLKPNFEGFGLPFVKENFAKLYKVVPVSDSHSVDIAWSLPPLLQEYESKPLHYISHLVGHEGIGSIISYLKKKVWATDIYAGNDESGFELNTTFSLFHIQVQLTSEGFEHVKEVLDVIFQYMNLLRKEGPIEWIFKEIQQMEEIDFKFAEEKCPIENVEGISESMQRYSPEHFLSGGSLLPKYDPELIKQCMELMQPNACNIMINSKNYEDECKDSEVWFGTKYSCKDTPSEWLSEWQSCASNPELMMPTVNLFIPDEFSIKVGEDLGKFPLQIDSSAKGELWFKQDFDFKLPRSHCYSYFHFNEMRNGPQMGAMLDLFLNLYLQQIMEKLYPASMAQYNVGIHAAEWGFVIKVTGFNQKLRQCVDLIITEMKKFSLMLDDKSFEEMKKQQLMSYHNALLNPDLLRRDLRLAILQEVHWQVAEKMQSLDQLSKLEFLNSFVSKINTQRYVRTLIQGNVTAEEAKDIHQMFIDSDLIHVCPEMRVRQLNQGENIVRAEGLNPSSCNTSVVNYYQGEEGCLMTEVINEFIIMAMDEPVFDTLRTKEQLGYHVYCTNRNTYGILGISITVNSQADKFSVNHIDGKIEDFLSSFCETLKTTSDEELSLLKKTLQDQKMTVDFTLKEQVDRNWNEIVSGEFLFDRFHKQVPLIENITRENACDYLHKLVSSSSRKKLSVQVVGSKDPKQGGVPTYQDVLGKNSSNQLVTFLPLNELDIQMGRNQDCFVGDLRSFAKKLPLYQVSKVLSKVRYL